MFVFLCVSVCRVFSGPTSGGQNVLFFLSFSYQLMDDFAKEKFLEEFFFSLQGGFHFSTGGLTPQSGGDFN